MMRGAKGSKGWEEMEGCEITWSCVSWDPHYKSFLLVLEMSVNTDIQDSNGAVSPVMS